MLEAYGAVAGDVRPAPARRHGTAAGGCGQVIPAATLAAKVGLDLPTDDGKPRSHSEDRPFDRELLRGADEDECVGVLAFRARELRLSGIAAPFRHRSVSGLTPPTLASGGRRSQSLYLTGRGVRCRDAVMTVVEAACSD
jgi:hypothetical protein